MDSVIARVSENGCLELQPVADWGEVNLDLAGARLNDLGNNPFRCSVCNEDTRPGDTVEVFLDAKPLIVSHVHCPRFNLNAIHKEYMLSVDKLPSAIRAARKMLSEVLPDFDVCTAPDFSEALVCALCKNAKRMHRVMGWDLEMPSDDDPNNRFRIEVKSSTDVRNTKAPREDTLLAS